MAHVGLGWVLHEQASDGESGGFCYCIRRGDAVHTIPGSQLAGLPTCAPRVKLSPDITTHEAWLTEHVHYQPSDIVIATFPKCGTTFVEQIVLLLLNGGVADALNPLCKNSIAALDGAGHVGKVWPEACLVPDDTPEPLQYPPGRPQRPEMRPMRLSAFNALPPPRVIKTHAPVTHLLSRQTDGTPAPARYIVVTRNPLDACVSCYYHAWHPQSSGWPFDAHALAWLDGRGNGSFGAQGTWCDFYTGWSEAAHRFPPPPQGTVSSPTAPAVLWLHYEALLRDPAREIRSIASFLGLDADDSDFINRVVEGSSFSRMRNAAVAAEDATENAIQDAKARPAYDVPGKLRQNERRLADHLRKGEIGDWRRHFDPYPGLLAAFEEAFADSCMGTCNGREWDCGEGQLMVTQRE